MNPRDVPRPPAGLQRAALLFFVAFLLIFPKGGIKLAGVPLTWGYIGLGAALLFLLGALATGRSGRVRKVRLLALALLLPFQVIGWLALLSTPLESVGFAVSFVVTFFAIPLVFVLGFGMYVDRVDLDLLLRAVRFGVLAVAAYGIFLFFYKLATGHFIEIPLLTVNAGDLGSLEDKYIDRGGIFKLISTYNNGNIYGVCILMLLPLHSWLETSLLKRTVVKVSLLLTLSRTVWVGLIVYEFLWRFFVKRISARTLVVLAVSLVVVGAGIWYSLDLLNADVSFLFDRKLGGRIGQLAALHDATVLPHPRTLVIREIVYLSILENFGLVGLTAFLAALGGPVLLYAARCVEQRSTGYKKSLVVGLCVYLIVAMSDGAILFIPVMAIYWFLVTLLLSDNPSFAGLVPAAAGAAPAAAGEVGPGLVVLSHSPVRSRDGA
jgi:hypothetical protein